jgi:hypothetical protein
MCRSTGLELAWCFWGISLALIDSAVCNKAKTSFLPKELAEALGLKGGKILYMIKVKELILRIIPCSEETTHTK